MNNSIGIYDDMYLTFWAHHLSDKIFWLYNSYQNYFDSWEDDFYDIINNHEDVFDPYQLLVMYSNAVVPLLIPIFLLLIALITIIIIPRYFYLQFCRTTKLIKEFKYTWFFGIKFLFTIILLGSLLLITTASTKSCIQLDETIRNNINQTRNLVTQIKKETCKFKIQLNNMNNSISKSLQSIQNIINDLPVNVYKNINTTIGQEMQEAVKSCNEIINKYDLIFERSGLKNTTSSIQNILEIELTTAITLMNKFINNTDILVMNVTKNDYNFSENMTENILEDISKIRLLIAETKGIYKFPNWTNIYNNLEDIFYNIIPGINNSLNFINLYQNETKNNIKPYEIEINNKIKQFKNETEFIINKLLEISKNIYHKSIRHAANNLLDLSNNYLISINRETSLFQEIYISSIFLVLPNIHAYLYTFAMILWCIILIYQMKCSNKFVMDSKFNNCTAILMKLILLFGLSLLWTGLILSAICNIGALSLSMMCRPIMSDHLYVKYTDNICVWNNKTWLDKIVAPWNHNYKLQEILEKCSKNVTVYDAFDVEKYWKISDLFKNNEISINDTELTFSIRNAINSVQLPKEELCFTAKNKFNLIENEIFSMSPHIMYDIEKFQNNNLKVHVQNMIQNYGDLLELHQNLDILNYIQNQKLDNILSNFMEFKYLLKNQQKELNKIENMEQQIKNKLNSNTNLLITNFVNNVTLTIKHVLTNLENEISRKAKNEIGNCYIFPFALEMSKKSICTEVPFILNLSSILLSLMSALLILSIFVCCQLITAIIQIQNERKIWHERLAMEKHNIRRNRILTGTLLFDRSGNFIGDSRTLVNPTNLSSERFLIPDTRQTT